MSTTSLQKRSSAGALAIRKYIGKFEALLFLPKLAYGLLQFNSAGELIASTQKPLTAYTADGAIALRSGIHVIEKTSAAAMTVAAPSDQDGEELTIVSNSDFAHVITFTGSTLLDGTTGANDTVTFAAFKGAAITVVARGSVWLVKSANAATITT